MEKGFIAFHFSRDVSEITRLPLLPALAMLAFASDVQECRKILFAKYVLAPALSEVQHL